MTPMQKEALCYVKNTNGGATRVNFIEDHEPVGELLWRYLHSNGLVTEDENGRIYATDALKNNPNI